MISSIFAKYDFYTFMGRKIIAEADENVKISLTAAEIRSKCNLFSISTSNFSEKFLFVGKFFNIQMMDRRSKTCNLT